MLATIVDIIFVAGFCWCIFCLLEYWFPVKIKEDRFEHFGHYKVIAVNTCKGKYYPWRDKYEVSYHYVLQDPNEIGPPFYYEAIRPYFDVGDSIYLKYKKNKKV